MISFKVASRRHAMLRNVVERGAAVADAVWRGVTGVGSNDDAVSIAVADTTPTQYATLLATDDIAAAFATAAVAEAFLAAPEPRNPQEARDVAHAGWAEFRALADQAGHQARGIGADQSAAWPIFRELQERPVDQAKMRRIADLAGRMYALLKGQRAKDVPNMPEEIVGLELGGNVQDLVHSEYGLLLDEDGEIDVLRRLTEHRAVQYKRTGKERKGRGPLVIALDESGSMIAEDGQARDDWAKAAMTALTRMAWESKRTVSIVHFSVATRVQRLEPGDYKGLLRAQRTFLDGGTNIGVALDVACDEVQALAKAGTKGADVVLVSDGGDAGDRIPAALDAMDRAHVRLFSVAIAIPFKGPLKARAAEYVHLSRGDLTSDNVTAAKGAVL